MGAAPMLRQATAPPRPASASRAAIKDAAERLPPTTRASKVAVTSGARSAVSARPEAPSRQWFLYAGIAAGVLGALLVVLAWLSSGRSPAGRSEALRLPPDAKASESIATNRKTTQDAAQTEPAAARATKDQPPAAKTTAPPDDYDPRALVAESLLAQAKQCLKQNPGDLWTYRDKLQEVQARFPGTPGAAEAGRLLAATPEPKLDPNLPAEDAWKQAVNLLAIAKRTADDLGPWTPRDGALVTSAAGEERLSLPYVPPAEYDVRVVFKRTQANEAVVFQLLRDGTRFAFVVSGWNNAATGFETVQGKRANELSSSNRTNGLIQNDKRYTLIIQVRRDVLRAYLNNRFICDCRAPNQDLGVFSAQVLFGFKPGQLGVGTFFSVYEFHQIEVLEVTGKGQVLTGQ